VSDADGPLLKRMQHHAATTAAIALDVDKWAPHLSPGGSAGTVTALGRSGWRVVGLTPQDRLDTVWRDLGRLNARTKVGT